MKTTSKTFLWIAITATVILSAAYLAFNFNRITSSIESRNARRALEKQISTIQSDTTFIENIHNIILMDESGSMSTLKETATDGAAEVIKSVQAASDTIANVNQFLTLAFFDGSNGRLRLDYIVNNQPISDVQADLKQYSPLGMTPLYDAIGETIVNHVGKVGPHDYVMMSIITDGYENYSQKYRASDIKMMVDSLSKKNWSFTYIGANQDAILEGGRMGINDAYNYDNTHAGYRNMIGSDTRRRNGRISRIATERGRGSDEQ